MKKQFTFIGIFIILISLGLSGCNQESNTLNHEKNKFIGTWQNTTGNITTTIILYSNDSCSFSTFTGIWSLKNGTLVMEVPDKYLIFTFNYAFSNNDKTLSLSSAVTTSTTTDFTKQS